MGTFIFLILGRAYIDTRFSLDAPSRTQNPRVTTEDTASKGITLLATVLYRRIQSQEVYLTYIKVGVECIGTDEPAAEDIAEPVSHLRRDEQVTELSLGLVVKWPGLVAHVETCGPFVVQADFNAQVRG